MEMRLCNLHDNSNYSGTNTNTLMIQHVRMSNEGDYKCLVKNMVNKEQGFSEEAKLTVLLFATGETYVLECMSGSIHGGM